MTHLTISYSRLPLGSHLQLRLRVTRSDLVVLATRYFLHAAYEAPWSRLGNPTVQHVEALPENVSGESPDANFITFLGYSIHRLNSTAWRHQQDYITVVEPVWRVLFMFSGRETYCNHSQHGPLWPHGCLL